MRNQQGGVVPKTMPIDISNVGVYNAATGRADRVGIKVLEDGKKVRIFKSNGELVPAKA
jgi:large subunit ribosomal protein L24